MSRYLPLVIVALSAVNMVAGIMDKDWSEALMAFTAILGWVTVWEYRKICG